MYLARPQTLSHVIEATGSWGHVRMWGRFARSTRDSENVGSTRPSWCYSLALEDLVLTKSRCPMHRVVIVKLVESLNRLRDPPFICRNTACY